MLFLHMTEICCCGGKLYSTISLGCPGEIWLSETKIGCLGQPKIPYVNPWCELRIKCVLFKRCDFKYNGAWLQIAVMNREREDYWLLVGLRSIIRFLLIVFMINWTLMINCDCNSSFGVSALTFNNKDTPKTTCPECKDTDLPAFISCSVVGVVLGDVSVYSIQC